MAEDHNFRSYYNEGRSKFQAIQNKVFWKELLSHLRGRHDELMSFDEIRSRLHLHEEHYEGVRDVPLDHIVGSVGRYKDFNSQFLPKRGNMRERWSRIYALANSMEGPPPIELYKVGDAYFVRDGNHRVSVARELGAKSIQAHVVELPTTVPLRPGMSAQELQSAEAYANFLDETGLSRAVPDHESIELSVPSRYHELMGHIFLHQRVMERLEGHALTTEKATADWYYTIYKPAIDLIRKYDVLDLAKGPQDAADRRRSLPLADAEPAGPATPVRRRSARQIFQRRYQILPGGRARPSAGSARARRTTATVMLTRTQAMKHVRKKREQQRDEEDPSATDALIS